MCVFFNLIFIFILCSLELYIFNFSLCVLGLTYDTDEQYLKEMFSRFGDVVEGKFFIILSVYICYFPEAEVLRSYFVLFLISITSRFSNFMIVYASSIICGLIGTDAGRNEVWNSNIE